MTYIRKPLFFIVLIFYYSGIVSAETSGADFLKIGPGSRAQGMGGAFVAVSDDATSVYYNPGGLGFIKRQEINLSRLKYLQKTSFSRLFYTRPFEKAATAGLSLCYLNSSGIPAYDNKGKSLADINTGAFAVTLGIGARLFKDIAAAGINLKFIRETLAGRGASAIAADGGILIKKDIISATGVLKNIDAWRAAAAVKNMGTKMKYFSSKESLPLIVSVGGAVELLSRDVILSLQTDFLPAGAGAVIFGAEYTFLDTVSVRAGWREKPFSAADADRGIRAGLGIKNDNMAVDYAYSPYNDIGNTHRVSLSLKFGKEYRKKRVLDNIKKHIEKGKELYHKGDFAGAAGKFRGVLEVDPANGEAQRWLEKVKRDMSLIQHAEEIKRYLDSGEKYFNELDIVNAQNEFLTVLDFDSSNKKALEFLRKIDLIIMWVADPEASREENRKMKLIKEKAFKERDEENPDKKEAAEDLIFYFSTGMKFASEGEADIAAAYFRRAANEDPDFSEIWFQLGKSYVFMEEYEKAAEAFLRAAEIEPGYLFVYHGLWDVYFKQQKYEKALEYINKSIKNMPDYGSNYRALGKTLKELQRYSEAAQAYKKLLEIWPDEKGVKIELVKALVKAGQIQKAVEYHRELKESNDEAAGEIEKLISPQENKNMDPE